ncbi:MAG: hypothetical protein ABI898_10060 [Sphingomonadales bacterium]
MKSFAIIVAPVALAACGGPVPASTNTVEDVAANQMAPDEVTEVQDDSATVESEESNTGNAHNAH